MNKQTFSINEDAVYTLVDDEVVMMSPKNDEYFTLNKIGAEIWHLLEESPKTILALTDALQEKYQVESAQVQQDIDAFTKEMLEQGFLETNTK